VKPLLTILIVVVLLPISYMIWLFVASVPVMGVYRIVVGAEYYDTHAPALAVRIFCYVIALVLAVETTRRALRRFLSN